MSKWFEPLPLSPPSETHTPASSISANARVRGQALGVLEPRGGAVADLHASPRQQRDVGVVHVHHVRELGARREHAPVRPACASGTRSRVLREGCEAKCIMPHPTPCRSASALGPADQRRRAGAEAEEERPRADPARPRAVHRSSIASFCAEGLLGRLPHPPRPRGEIPGPPAEDRPHADRSTASATAADVEERARLAEGRRAGADHLDAGQERGVLLVLRRDDGVERDQPVGQVAVHRDVVEEQAAVEVLGEVDVGVHEAGEHHRRRPSMTRSGGRGGRTRGGPDLDDVARRRPGPSRR